MKSNYKISEHKDEIITGIIRNLIWVPIAAIIPLIWKLIQFLYSNISWDSLLTFSNILALVAIIISVTAIVVVMKFRFSKSVSKNQKQVSMEPITDFRINLLVAEFHIKNSDEIISTLDYDITANRNNVQSFKKPILWTGDKYIQTKLIHKNCAEYTLHDKGVNDGYHICEICFNKEIKCQDKIKFKLETMVSDLKSQMQPFYGYTVKHQTDMLILRVVVEPNKIHNVRKCICWDWERQMTVEEPEPIPKKTIGGNEVYEIEIPSPTLLYKYLIEWEFTK